MRAWVVGAVGLVGCSLISLDNLRGDGGVQDGASDITLDVPSDTTDGGDGGDGSTPIFHCTESAGTRLEVATNLRATLVRRSPTVSGTRRVVAADYFTLDSGLGYELVWRAYIINGVLITPVPLVTTGFTQALALRRYSVNGHSGFVALYQANDVSLFAALLPDEQSTWTTPLLLTSVVGDAGAASNMEADIEVLDPTTQDFFVAYSVLVGKTQTIYAGEVKNATTALPLLASYTSSVAAPTYALSSPAVAYRNQVGYILLGASGNGPPPPGAPALMLTTMGGKASITPPSNLNYLPLGFADAVDPTLIDAFVMIANLGNLTASLAVGQVPATMATSLNPQTLPNTVPANPDGGAASLVDLVFGGQTVHWDSPNASADQLLYVGAAIDPIIQRNLGGIDLAWWDGPSGALRTYSAGSGALFSDIYASSADAVLTSLAGSVAQVEFAWSELSGPDAGANNYPPPPSSLWVASAGCVK